MEEKKLLRLLKKSPQDGIKEAMHTYGKAVETICTNFLSDLSQHDIEEAIADTFIKLWQNADKIKLDKENSLKSYLYAIARNTARDKRRKLQKESYFPLEEVLLDLPSELNVEQEFAKRSNEKILYECLNEFGEPDKSVFLLRYFYGEKIKSIANRVGLSEKKTENILYRGKRKLEQTLQKRGIFHE